MPNFLKTALREMSRNLLVLVALVGMATVAFAFTEPSVAPPDGSVNAPINTSGIAQTKSGSFTSSGTVVGNILNAVSSLSLAGTSGITKVVSQITGPVGATTNGANVAFNGAGVSQSGNTFTFSGGGASQWLNNGSDIYYNSGEVGIGTASPLQKLHVAGGDFEESDGSSGFIFHSRSLNGYDFLHIAPKTGGAYEWGKGIKLIRSNGNVMVSDSSGSLGVGNPGMPSTGGSLVARRNLYTSSDGGSVVGFGELGQAQTDYGAALIMGCGWSAANGLAGCISSLPIVFQTAATGNDPYSQVTAGTILIKQRTSDTRHGVLTHTGQSGNFHIDSWNGGNTYINWYAGQSVNIGNGAQGYGPIYASAYLIGSSIKLKKDISASPYGLQEILKLEPKQFRYIDDPSGALKIGFIAEEVAPIIPEVVSLGDDGMPKGIDYGQLTTALVGAVREQQKEIDVLKVEIELLKAR